MQTNSLIFGALLGIVGKAQAVARRQFYDSVFGGADVPVSSFIYQRPSNSAQRPELWTALVQLDPQQWKQNPRVQLVGEHTIEIPTAPSSSLSFSEVDLVSSASEYRSPLAICDPSTTPAFQWSPPFSDQPQHSGAINWCDVITLDGYETIAAQLLRDVLGWRLTVPLPFPPSGKYITCLNAHGAGRTNGEKLCGVLPGSALRLTAPQGSTVPFFACKSADEVEDRLSRVQPAGGSVVFPPSSADGTFALATDLAGSPFALYHRTDGWNEVKPTTQLETSTQS